MQWRRNPGVMISLPRRRRSRSKSTIIHLILQLFLQQQQFPCPLINRILHSHTRIKATVQTLPQLDVPCTRDRLQHNLASRRIPGIQRIPVLITGRVDERPEGDGCPFQIRLPAFPFCVEEERAEATGVQVIQHGDQQMFVKLECVWELLTDLPDTVDELQEDRRTIRIRMVTVSVSDALLELVSEAQPLLLDQHLEAFQSAVIRIEEEH